MASSHRRLLLKQVASSEREMESDVIARIALDEIAELDDKLNNFRDITAERPDPNKVVTHGPPYLKKGRD